MFPGRREMSKPLNDAINRTLRQAHDFEVTDRGRPAWLDAQLDAIAALCSGDTVKSLTLYIAALQLERERLEALEKTWKLTP